MFLSTLPSTNTDMVGIDMMPYSRAVSGFSSMFSLTMRSLSPCSLAISSSTGATILHGPHHSAQKSTSTGTSLFSTSVQKLSSLTGTVLPMRCLPSVTDPGPDGSGQIGELLRGSRSEPRRSGDRRGCERRVRHLGLGTDPGVDGGLDVRPLGLCGDP